MGVDMSALSRAISHRHRGVGSDGLILISPARLPAVDADVRMEMYNADGSAAKCAANGIRCVAKYAIERGLVNPQSAFRNPQIRFRGKRSVERSASAPNRVESIPGDTGRNPRPPRHHRHRPSRANRSRHLGTYRVRLRRYREIVRVDMGSPILKPAEVPVTIPGDRLREAPLCNSATKRLAMTCVSMGNPHAYSL